MLVCLSRIHGLGVEPMRKKGSDSVHTWLILGKAYRAILRPLIAQYQKDSALILSDFGILEVLLHKGPQPVSVIGPKVDLNDGSISVAVDRLYERGLVNREESPNDRRVRLVSLTAEGKKVISAAFRKHAAQIESLFSVLSADDQAQLQTLLRKLGRHAESVSSLKPRGG
jgi:MarR family 2-MHQ and catechol resistance regulon transcriptional repressor